MSAEQFWVQKADILRNVSISLELYISLENDVDSLLILTFDSSNALSKLYT